MKLSGITWDHPRGFAPLAAGTKALAAATGVDVDWEARSLKDFGDAPIETLARDYDLLIIDYPHVGVAAETGCVAPLDALLPEAAIGDRHRDYVGPSFGSFRYRGHQWALPVDAACQVSARRSDLLGGRDLPATWEEAFDLARELRKQGLSAAMALCPTDAMCAFLTLAAQAGDPPAEGRPELVARETGLRALECLRRLAEACHPESLGWNPIQLFDRMAASDEIAYAPLAFGYITYARPGPGAKPLAFGGIPGGAGSLLGGAGIAVSAAARDPAAAARAAAWLAGGAHQSGACLASGGQPAHRAAWDAPPQTPGIADFLRDTRPTIENAYVRPRDPRWPAFQEWLGERIAAFLAGSGTATTAMAAIDERYAWHFSDPNQPTSDQGIQP